VQRVSALPADEQVPGRQRLSAEDRRSAIVDAARRLFARNGFHGTGTSEIAAAAGCSEPVIYKHFSSKQALFAAALEDATRIMAERFASAAEGEGDRYDAYLRFVRSLSCNAVVADVWRLRHLAVTLTANPEIRASLEHMLAAWQARVRAAVEDGRAHGSIRQDADVEAVTMLFFGLGLSAGFMSAVEGEEALARFPSHIEGLVSLLTPIQGEAG
jgi:AcrR family transcriptional regulator